MTPRWIVPIVAALALGISVSAQAATVEISMENLEISPAEASAKVGDTVRLVNKDDFAHTATARNGDFDMMIPPKKTVSMVLKKAGKVEYYCRFHPNMKAVLNIVP
ncbi:MAG: cupredoxin domain-containing protein [Bradyrhizobium sp.]|uniref:cupredoxin domain-containing protein n=1 Tax=Bradyrhizobium sp. TaxID=376 RepID=UPI001C297D9B|nr:cupredoxin domain-containing protein [Bradyrhizobium sp.]MBU6461328.1 cupredoxin domain-containing protein [Pseudomonadota bacterium]MDE2066502.1 cupredoxin domain-containing protein [Bradyrhizobium sp.]MDE2241592.1 cupredoxin domain-containing protein [Bradyrhizobium sp.]MDE2469153.1 cupredoxin domain-containing protein [Bradyrhizobium sp.]